jgi:hypothetical protein
MERLSEEKRKDRRMTDLAVAIIERHKPATTLH